MKPKLVLLGMLAEDVNNWHRDDPSTHVWACQGFYAKTNVIPDMIWDIHKSMPIARDGVEYALWPMMYNVYNRPVMTHPDATHFYYLNPTLRLKYPQSLIAEFGGPDNFTSTVSYMLAYAVRLGYTRIELVGIRMDDAADHLQELAGLVDLIDHIRNAQRTPAVGVRGVMPNVRISCKYETLWRELYPTLPRPDPRTWPRGLPYGDIVDIWKGDERVAGGK